MNFQTLLELSQSGNAQATHDLIHLYRPLLVRLSIIDNTYDPDLYQELVETMLNTIKIFKI